MGAGLTFLLNILFGREKNPKAIHCFHYEMLKQKNGGREMPDIWKMPSPGSWERTCGKHPTQKPLRLLYRVLKVCTEEGFTILDPFAGSCTTGIAAKLLNRRFIGIELNSEYLDYGVKRWVECQEKEKADKLLKKMSENPEEGHCYNKSLS